MRTAHVLPEALLTIPLFPPPENAAAQPYTGYASPRYVFSSTSMVASSTLPIPVASLDLEARRIDGAGSASSCCHGVGIRYSSVGIFSLPSVLLCSALRSVSATS